MANFNANLNKENLIEVAINKATVSVKEGSMNFYITDERTCNIYCQLVYDASTNTLIKNHMEVDNAEDFEITMRIIKPNNEPKKELKFELLDQSSAMFYVSLTDEYKDFIGTYKCELFVDCYANGLLERITTSSFSYKVNKSIMNKLDSIIEKDPDYPLVDEILKQLETVDLNNYATKKYVEDAIANIDISGIDLSEYATNESVDKKIAAIELTPGPVGPMGPEGPAGPAPDLEIYATKEYVDDAVANIDTGDIDLSDYATTEYVDNIIYVIDKGSVNNEITFDDFKTGQYTYKLNGCILGNNNHNMKFRNEIAFVSKIDLALVKKLTIYRSRSASFGTGLGLDGSDYLEIEYPSKECKHGYNATKEYVDEAIANIEVPDIDLTDYATKEYVDDIITVIKKTEIGFDDFPEGYGIYKLEGSLRVKDINGNSLTSLGECYDELVKVNKTSNVLYVYTMDNKYFELDITKGTAQKSRYDVSKEYVREQIASISLTSYATKVEMNTAINNALGDIETLLGEI